MSDWQKGQTKETQYQDQVELYKNEGPVSLGLTTGHTWRVDPKRLVFLLARYKFVSRMLQGYPHILEVGCGDGFGARLVAQSGSHVTCCDFDPVFIEEARQREKGLPNVEFKVADFLKSPWAGPQFDAAYLLDVIEHIQPKDEERFIQNIASSLKPSGVAIFGAPSLESQVYASEWSRKGHVNCKKGEDFRKTFQKHFDHVFLFSMNDEVVHTGFSAMAHYLLALCVGVKK